MSCIMSCHPPFIGISGIQPLEQSPDLLVTLIHPPHPAQGIAATVVGEQHGSCVEGQLTATAIATIV